MARGLPRGGDNKQLFGDQGRPHKRGDTRIFLKKLVEGFQTKKKQKSISGKELGWTSLWKMREHERKNIHM